MLVMMMSPPAGQQRRVIATGLYPGTRTSTCAHEYHYPMALRAGNSLSSLAKLWQNRNKQYLLPYCTSVQYSALIMLFNRPLGSILYGIRTRFVRVRVQYEYWQLFLLQVRYDTVRVRVLRAD